MKIIGITGCIASGKSTLAYLFKKNGFPVFNADKCIHSLYTQDKNIISYITQLCPDALKADIIERTFLKKAIIQNPLLLDELEKITHPQVLKALILFIKQNLHSQQKLIVLDIPLLFAIKGQIICDLVITLTLPFHLQQTRLKTKNINNLVHIFNKKHNRFSIQNKILINKSQAATYVKTILAQLEFIKPKNNFFSPIFINQFQALRSFL